ncbi:MAG TPA: hypothetical protein VIW26_00175 [Gemmatimonadales bacterium]
MSAPHIDCERHHAALSVPDVATAVEFYVTRLRFRRAFVEGDYDSHASYRFVEQP